jgi:hypothetical protein
VIRVTLPYHLRNLASVDKEVQIDVLAPVTLQRVLDALEHEYPMLAGTIRDHATKERRAFVRFFACNEDISHEPLEYVLPVAISTGEEPLRIIGAMAGG